MNDVFQMGHFPVDGPAGREAGVFYKINNDNALYVVNGKKLPTLMKFFVSNDVVHVGQHVVPAGGIGPRQTEYDTHPGDAVFYVEDYEMAFQLPDIEQTFLVKPGEFMFIPSGNRYKMINYNSKPAHVVFIVAPRM